MKTIKVLILLLFFFNISSAFADNYEKIDKISKNLRCLICQGQSVYDSQSDFAISMKILINNKIKEGRSENEIYEILKEKYGDWIVYEPEFNRSNLLLWLIPLVLFVFGGILIIRNVSMR